MRRSSFSENKAALKKSQHMREVKSPFEKKSQIKLRLIEIIFPESLALISIHEESHMNTYWALGDRNRPRKKSLGYICVILSS